MDFSSNLEQLSSAVWAHAALATALELGVLDYLQQPTSEAEIAERCRLDPELVADLVETLVALAAIERDGDRLVPTPSFELLLSPSLVRVLGAEVRGDLLQTRELLHRAREGADPVGWKSEDPVALTAQGDTGSLIGLLVEALLPGLDGLAERMARPDARILDVGAGVGVVSSELCRLWPHAEAVGLEPHTTARELGRSRIAAAGLADRIALRDECVEALGELDAYDLAFVPQPFLPRAALAAGLPRIRRALRPGGWILVLTTEQPDDLSLLSASRRFRARIWGGGAMEPEEIGCGLVEAGFDAVQLDHPIGSFRVICARRAGTADEHSNPVFGASMEPRSL